MDRAMKIVIRDMWNDMNCTSRIAAKHPEINPATPWDHPKALASCYKDFKIDSAPRKHPRRRLNRVLVRHLRKSKKRIPPRTLQQIATTCQTNMQITCRGNMTPKDKDFFSCEKCIKFGIDSWGGTGPVQRR